MPEIEIKENGARSILCGRGLDALVQARRSNIEINPVTAELVDPAMLGKVNGFDVNAAAVPTLQRTHIISPVGVELRPAWSIDAGHIHHVLGPSHRIEVERLEIA